jgi:hypothetical protein
MAVDSLFTGITGLVTGKPDSGGKPSRWRLAGSYVFVIVLVGWSKFKRVESSVESAPDQAPGTKRLELAA